MQTRVRVVRRAARVVAVQHADEGACRLRAVPPSCSWRRRAARFPRPRFQANETRSESGSGFPLPSLARFRPRAAAPAHEAGAAGAAASHPRASASSESTARARSREFVTQRNSCFLLPRLDGDGEMAAGRRRVAAITSHLTSATTEIDLDSLTVDDPERPLSAEQIEHFMMEGYVALPGIIPDDFNAQLKADTDALMADRASKDAQGRLIASYNTLGELCSWPPVVDKVMQLMANYGNGETQCGMHHIHANRQSAGTGSSNWHQASAVPRAFYAHSRTALASSPSLPLLSLSDMCLSVPRTVCC